MDNTLFVYTDNYGDKIEVKPVLNMYADNDNLFLGLESYDDDLEGWDSYCDVTVNIFKLPFLESAINVNYGGQEKIAFLVNNGFGQLTGQTLASGLCTYPVFRFNAEKIKELDPAFFEKYAKAHELEFDSHTSLESKISGAESIKNNKNSLNKEVKRKEDFCL